MRLPQLRGLAHVSGLCQGVASVVEGYPLNSAPVSMFGYCATLFFHSVTGLMAGPIIQPMSILLLNRLYRSAGSLPRSNAIGHCGVTIGLSSPARAEST